MIPAPTTASASASSARARRRNVVSERSAAGHQRRITAADEIEIPLDDPIDGGRRCRARREPEVGSEHLDRGSPDEQLVRACGNHWDVAVPRRHRTTIDRHRQTRTRRRRRPRAVRARPPIGCRHRYGRDPPAPCGGRAPRWSAPGWVRCWVRTSPSAPTRLLRTRRRRRRSTPAARRAPPLGRARARPVRTAAPGRYRTGTLGAARRSPSARSAPGSLSVTGAPSRPVMPRRGRCRGRRRGCSRPGGTRSDRRSSDR